MFKSVTATDIPSSGAPKSPPQSPIIDTPPSNDGAHVSCPSKTTAVNEDISAPQRVVLKEQRLEDIKNQCSALISELE